MKKIIILLLSLHLCADTNIPQHTKQLLIVSSTDVNATKAVMQAYEYANKHWKKVFDPIPVNLGKNGLAWGRGNFKIPNNAILKQEGDAKAPSGLFSLDSFFGYEEHNFNFPYLKLEKEHICVDDSESKNYTKIISTHHKKQYQSYEDMKRNDNLYALGIVVGHNKKAVKQAGSCIFIHIQRNENSPTAGCTSLKEEKLLMIMKWLDYDKHPMLYQGTSSHTKILLQKAVFPHKV